MIALAPKFRFKPGPGFLALLFVAAINPFLSPVLANAQAQGSAPAPRLLRFDYPSGDLPKVFFWFQRATNLNGQIQWETMATIALPLNIEKIPATNLMAFYRVGADWRENAPSWMTNDAILQALAMVRSQATNSTPPSQGSRSKVPGSKPTAKGASTPPLP